MRLRRKVSKKAAALAVVAAVAVSVPASASAVTYEASKGTVTVEKNEDEGFEATESGSNAKSYQTDSDGNKVKAKQDEKDENGNDVYAEESTDKNITITGDSKSTEADTDKPIVDVKDGVEGANITIKDVTADVDNDNDDTTDDSAVNVGKNVKDVTITIENTNISSNIKRDAAIDIGEDSNVDVTIDNVNITIGDRDDGHNDVWDGQSGIRTGEGSTVDLTVNGKNTIKAADGAIDQMYNTWLPLYNGDNTNDMNLNGVVAGGSGADGFGDGEKESTLNITTSEEDSSLTIDGMLTGIAVHNGAKVDIDGNGDDDDIDEDKALTVNVENTQGNDSKYHTTKSGRGIWSSGDITIEDDAKVNIDNSQRIGLYEGVNANTTVKDSAELSITKAKDQAGIYLQDNANLTVTGEGTKLYTNQTSYVGGAIIAEGNGNQTITFSDGAHVELSNKKEDGTNLAGDAINMRSGTNGKLVVTGNGTVVDIHDFGNYGEGLIWIDSNNHVEILNNATVNLDGSQDNGVQLYGKNNSLTINNAKLLMKSRLVFSSFKPKDDTTSSDSTIEIQSGAKVVTPTVLNFGIAYDKDNNVGGNYNFWITGGTLELTQEDGEGWGLDKGHHTQVLYAGQDKDESGNKNYIAWPTNSPTNGDEKLVNFKLNKDSLVDLVNSLTADGAEYNPETNTVNIKAYAYVNDKVQAYDYIIDLNKYEDGEDIDVWVPAVILDYYYPFDELPDSEDDAIDDSKAYTKHGKYDVIMRGHSIAFATLKDDGTTNDYTTGNMTSEDVVKHKTKTWYYWDASENGGKGAWKVFSATTPLMVYSRGSSLSDAKPIIGIHTHDWDEEHRDEHTLIPSDCRYHGLAGDPCNDSDCNKVHTVVLPLDSHDWMIKYDDNTTNNGLTLTPSEEDKSVWLDAEGNKYHIDDQGVWKITKEATYEEDGSEMLVCIRHPGEGTLGYVAVPDVDEIITDKEAEALKAEYEKDPVNFRNTKYKASTDYKGEDEETPHLITRPIDKLKPVTPPDVPEKEKKEKDDGDDDIVPVVPPVVPVVPAETTETTVPEVVPVAETTTTPVVPAEPVAPATPADTTPKLPQTGADWFSAIGMAAAGLALSIGSLFGKGKHEKE